jgi:twinfilin-like protein
VPSNVQDEFKAFTLNKSLLALPLRLEGATLQYSTAIQCNDEEDHTSQLSLGLLEDILVPTRSLYLLLRRSDSIAAVTFIPYRAAQEERNAYLKYRNNLVKLLGKEHFQMSLICKESGEIVDARSWVERGQHRGEDADPNHLGACDNPHHGDSEGFADLGYKKNNCRLCDRRMKNRITDEASDALGKLEDEGMLVQIVCLNRQSAPEIG